MYTFYTVKSNGLKMVKSYPLNWRVEGDVFMIYVGDMLEGHNCFFKDDILTISNISFDSTDPPIKLKVYSLEEAGLLVYKLAKGMNISLEGTVYKDRLNYD